MPLKKLEITNVGPVGTGIVLDGTDIANHVNKLSLVAEVGEIPKVVLSLVVIPSVSGDAKVSIDSPTHDLLVGLGWTPPEE